jgi:hypothetical protein
MANIGTTSLNPVLTKIANARGALPNNLPAFTRSFTYFHRLNVPKGGQQSFTFFNASRQSGVTNLEQAGTLPVNTVFTIRAIRFSFLPGFDTAGIRLGYSSAGTTERIASSMNYAAVTNNFTGTADPLGAAYATQWAEKSRELMDQGEVILSKGDRTVYSAYGLTKFPQGRGLVTDTSLAISSTSTNVYAGEVFSGIYNGAPLAGNVHRLAGDVTIRTGETFKIDVGYSKIVDFTEATVGPLAAVTNAITAGVLMCELDGDIATSVQ